MTAHEHNRIGRRNRSICYAEWKHFGNDTATHACRNCYTSGMLPATQSPRTLAVCNTYVVSDSVHLVSCALLHSE
jgi:hypothetical protein